MKNKLHPPKIINHKQLKQKLERVLLDSTPHTNVLDAVASPWGMCMRGKDSVIAEVCICMWVMFHYVLIIHFLSRCGFCGYKRKRVEMQRENDQLLAEQCLFHFWRLLWRLSFLFISLLTVSFVFVFHFYLGCIHNSLTHIFLFFVCCGSLFYYVHMLSQWIL